MSHCDDCLKGVVIPGESTGKVEKIGGVDAYFTKSSDELQTAIILATDIFGYQLNNAQLVADTIASNTGYQVLIPDMFNNDSLSPSVFALDEKARGEAFGAWFGRHGSFHSKVPILLNVIKELKEKRNVSKVGVVGYCFGGGAAVLLAADDQVSANVICHPAKLEIPKEIEGIKNPTLWICAEYDHLFVEDDRKKAQEILQQKGANASFKLYPGTAHGFALRGDPSDPKIEASKLSALQETINFLKSNLN